MKITKHSETPIKETAHKIDARLMYDKDSAQAVVITLKPEESLKPHITATDVFFFVLEGTPDVLVGDETKTVEKDCLIESPKNIVHCLSNNSTEVAKILVVKAPKPTEKTVLL